MLRSLKAMRPKVSKKKPGFTLVELIMVMIILAIIASVAIPNLAAFQDNARKSRIESEHRQLVSAVQSYIGEYSSDPIKAAESLDDIWQDLGHYISDTGKPKDDLLAYNEGEIAHKIVGQKLVSTFTDVRGKTTIWEYPFGSSLGN